MAKIFISYRRGDSAGHTGRLYDRLADHFGQDQVFMDVDTIRPGQELQQQRGYGSERGGLGQIFQAPAGY